MKAVGFTRPLPISHHESLIDLELPAPEPSERDLLIEVRAVAVNPVDAKVRAQRTPPTEGPPVLGWDGAGVVKAIGPAVSSFSVGDEVYFAGDITRPGSNSQLCLVDERIAARKPKRLDFAEAAAMPLTTLTAYEALFDRMRFPRGEGSRGKSLLIVGGAGGVGSIAIQIAKTLTNATVITTASRPESTAWVKGLGADHVIDHRQPFGPQLSALGLGAIDHILCTADTDRYFAPLVELVAPQGTVCFIVRPKVPADMVPVQLKSVTIAWELMYTRCMFQTPDMIEQQRLLTEVASLIDDGRIRHTLTRRLSPICARTLREAHAQIESGTTIGKLAIEGWG